MLFIAFLQHSFMGALYMFLLTIMLLSFMFLTVWIGFNIRHGGNCRNCIHHNRCPSELADRCPEGRTFPSARTQQSMELHLIECNEVVEPVQDRILYKTSTHT